MTIKLYNLNTPSSVRDLYQKKINKLIDNSDWILGKELLEFESSFASFIGTKYAIGLNSGTDALELSLKSLNIGKGDEVIVPGYSFFATSEVVLKVGAKPVYADISKEDLNIDIKLLTKLITNKTRAIIPVHLFGNSVNMDELNEVISSEDIYIIEDTAQALGSTYNNQKLGSLGKLGCFSFYPTKNIGAFGDAGAITTDDKELYEKIILLRNHGQSEKYFHEIVGYNSRMDNIQAAILNIKLKLIEEIQSKKIKTLEIYEKNLGSNTDIIYLGQRGQPLNQLPIGFHSRDITNKVKLNLSENNIEYGEYYPYGLHEFSFSEHNKEISLVNIDWAKDHTFTIPCHDMLSKEDINLICKIIQNSI